MKILGVITARGGSKGVPRKNIKLLNGKPLVAYTIEAAKKSNIFDRIILSTEDEEIASTGKEFGVEVPFVRPLELAGDSVPTISVLVHALEWLRTNEGYIPDAVMLLQPTAPLRKPEHIREAQDLFVQSGADSVVSMTEVPLHLNAHWQFLRDWQGRATIATGEAFHEIVKRRQELPVTYARNGAIYLFKTPLLFGEIPSFYGETVCAYLMDEASSINIDSPEDFAEAESCIAIDT